MILKEIEIVLVVLEVRLFFKFIEEAEGEVGSVFGLSEDFLFGDFDVDTVSIVSLFSGKNGFSSISF